VTARFAPVSAIRFSERIRSRNGTAGLKRPPVDQENEIRRVCSYVRFSGSLRRRTAPSEPRPASIVHLPLQQVSGRGQPVQLHHSGISQEESRQQRCQVRARTISTRRWHPPRRSMLALSALANKNSAIGKNAHPPPNFLPAHANARYQITSRPWRLRRTRITLCGVTGGALGSSSHREHCTTILFGPQSHHFLKMTATAAMIMAKPTR
jgi:hypothetical protein